MEQKMEQKINLNSIMDDLLSEMYNSIKSDDVIINIFENIWRDEETNRIVMNLDSIMLKGIDTKHLINILNNTDDYISEKYPNGIKGQLFFDVAKFVSFYCLYKNSK